MNETEWKGYDVEARMSRCLSEAKDLDDNWSRETQTFLAIGLYNAYRHKWGD
jgi:hypothetical protein